MKKNPVEEAARARVDEQVKRNAERLVERYSVTSKAARRNIAVRENYVQNRALRPSAK